MKESKNHLTFILLLFCFCDVAW